MRKISQVKNSLVLNDFEALLHRLTSNEEAPPAQEDLAQLAQATYVPAEREALMQHLWRKLYGPRHKWRKILKALMALQRALVEGSPAVEQELREKISLLNFLLQFRFEERSEDVGERIRALAGEIIQRVKAGERARDNAPPPRRPAPFYFSEDFLVYERPSPPTREQLFI